MTGQYKPQTADEDVGEGVQDRVAVVAERGGLFTASSDNELRVLASSFTAGTISLV